MTGSERGAAEAVRRGARRTAAAAAAVTLAAAAGVFALVGTMQADADTATSGTTSATRTESSGSGSSTTGSDSDRRGRPRRAAPSRCGLAETARVLRYLALESAGQCGPCLNGLPRIAATFPTLAAPGPQGGTREDIARWAGLVEGRGACHHPDGTVRLVRSALTTFAAELDAHAAGHCTATDHSPLLPVPANRN
jgi:hypothetical protein